MKRHLTRTRLERQYPWLDDRSAWREEVIPERTARATMHTPRDGGWVCGNGHVSAVKQGRSATRLGAILGPTYERTREFPGWGAQTLTVRREDIPVIWQRAEAFRIRRTAILGSELSAPGLRVLLLDLAPPEWPLLQRIVMVQNTGEETLCGITIDVEHHGQPAGEMRQRPDGWEVVRPERCLRVVSPTGIVRQEGSRFAIEVPELLPGDDEVLHLFLITGQTEQEVELLAAKATADPDDLPGITYRWWQDWMADTLAVAGDDPRLGDLLDDAKALIAVQQGPGGVIAPLAERTQATVIDEAAALRFLLAIGKPAAVRPALEARYHETCRQGAFAHALPAALPPLALPEPEPAWETLTPPPAWTAAAIVRLHCDYLRQTGDEGLILRHLRYLHWLVQGQPVSPEGLVPFGGDEPFYTAFQRALPLELQERLIPDPGPYAMMHPRPWGAAPAMALAAAADLLVAVAEGLQRHEDVRRLGELASRVRVATERTYWLPEEGYYAAWCSGTERRVAHTPHLPTALAPFITGYAAGEEEHARQGLDETLQYLIDAAGLPRVAPEVEPFPGTLSGDLLAVMALTGDLRMHRVYGTVLGCASPAGEFRALYGPAEGMRRDGVAHPAIAAGNLLGLLEYLCAGRADGEVLALAPHLPPELRHLHVAGLRAGGYRVDTVVDARNGTERVQISNAGPSAVTVRLGEPRAGEAHAFHLNPGERHRVERPRPATDLDLLPTPCAYRQPARDYPPAPVLVLTVDPESFSDWQESYHALMLDLAPPPQPEDLARALVQDPVRRYDALYLDVPEEGAAWTGLSDAFWDDARLRDALERFRDLGGIVTGTLFVDSWQIRVAGREPGELASRHAWITLPHVPGVVTATSIVPWESADEEEVELLLFAADGLALDLWVNGEHLWQREPAPEGHRVRLTAVFHPGENSIALRGEHRPGRGFGFCLGIRSQLSWNTRPATGGIARAA